MEPLAYAAYVAIKYFAYTGWCGVGIRLLREPGSHGSAAFGFGLLRLLLGVLFGFGVFIAGAFLHLNVPNHPLLVYFGVYAPVRLVEWTIMAQLLRVSPHVTSGRKLGWIVGGIVVSHAADVPLFLLTGTSPGDMLPVGRFLC